jgi:hypothetical protein
LDYVKSDPQDIVNETAIHIELSENFFEQEETLSGIYHLLTALMSSPPAKQNPTHFVKLIANLNLMEQFDEAQSVIDAVRSPYHHVSSMKPFHISRELDIVQAIVKVRRGKFGEAYEEAKAIAKQFQFSELANLEERIAPATVEPFNLLAHLLQENDPKVDDTDTQREQAFQETANKIVKFARNKITETVIRLESMLRDLSSREMTFNQSVREKMQQVETKRHVSWESYRHEHGIESDPLYRKYRESQRQNSTDSSQADKFIPFVVRHPLDIFSELREQARDSTSYGEAPPFETALHLTAYRLQFFKLEKALQRLLLDSSGENKPELQISNQLLLAILNRSVREVELYAELCNVLAYAKAELDIRLPIALADARHALLVMSVLYALSAPMVENHLRKYRENLALYFDTWAWIHYRAANTYSTHDETINNSDRVQSDSRDEQGLAFVYLNLYFAR